MSIRAPERVANTDKVLANRNMMNQVSVPDKKGEAPSGWGTVPFWFVLSSPAGNNTGKFQMPDFCSAPWIAMSAFHYQDIFTLQSINMKGIRFRRLWWVSSCDLRSPNLVPWKIYINQNPALCQDYRLSRCSMLSNFRLILHRGFGSLPKQFYMESCSKYFEELEKRKRELKNWDYHVSTFTEHQRRGASFSYSWEWWWEESLLPLLWEVMHIRNDHLKSVEGPRLGVLRFLYAHVFSASSRDELLSQENWRQRQLGLTLANSEGVLWWFDAPAIFPPWVFLSPSESSSTQNLILKLPVWITYSQYAKFHLSH